MELSLVFTDNTFIKQAAPVVVNDTLQELDITRIVLYVEVSTALTSSRNIICFSDTMSNFQLGIKDRIAKITNRRSFLTSSIISSPMQS
jgi:hypothetical protein